MSPNVSHKLIPLYINIHSESVRGGGVKILDKNNRQRPITLYKLILKLYAKNNGQYTKRGLNIVFTFHSFMGFTAFVKKLINYKM